MQKRISSVRSAKKDDEEFSVPKRDEKSDEAKAEADEFLDAIDAVLEENAEEFVSSFVQKGGE